MGAEVTRMGLLDMQVCVPSAWSAKQAKVFADEQNPCGTEHGWLVRKAGDPLLAGQPARRECESRAGHVHIMLDA